MSGWNSACGLPLYQLRLWWRFKRATPTQREYLKWPYRDEPRFERIMREKLNEELLKEQREKFEEEIIELAELFKTKRDACETPKEFAICENDDAKPCGSKEPEHIVPDVCNGNEIEIELSEIMTENQSSENCEENANESESNLEEPE